MITLPANLVSETMTNAGTLFSDFMPLAILAIGILVAFAIIDKICNKKEQNNDTYF